MRPIPGVLDVKATLSKLAELNAMERAFMTACAAHPGIGDIKVRFPRTQRGECKC